MRDKRINIDDISYLIPNMEIKSDTDYLEDHNGCYECKMDINKTSDIICDIGYYSFIDNIDFSNCECDINEKSINSDYTKRSSFMNEH